MNQECINPTGNTSATKRWVIEHGDGWLRIGPVLVTTWTRHKASERNAFEIGMGAQRHLDARSRILSKA